GEEAVTTNAITRGCCAARVLPDERDEEWGRTSPACQMHSPRPCGPPAPLAAGRAHYDVAVTTASGNRHPFLFFATLGTRRIRPGLQRAGGYRSVAIPQG